LDRWVAHSDETGDTVRVVGGMVDVTDRHKLELLLQQSQKMQAVGQLAGGIAHDFNNLLLAIGGNAELLQQSPVLREQDQADVGEIVRAAGRAAELTSQLLTFSRAHRQELGSVDLNGVVTEVETLLRRLLGAHIEMATSLDPGAAAIVGTGSGIEQVIVNLALNARDAMPGGGLLSISTRSEPDMGQVRLVVEDTGEGMDEATSTRVFEPFFTTKDIGKGTGLGLATVYGIVEHCGGSVELESRPGEGTRFDVVFPCAEEPVEARRGLAPAASPGSEQILLVEDEPGVRGVVTRMLVAHGYSVVAAEGPTEALELLQPGGFVPDLVISDLVMPNLSGVEFAARAELLQPGTMFLFISGYSGHRLLGDTSLPGATQLLQKPFTAAELTNAARQALDARVHASTAVLVG
jgi:nitrogen-specific signal transduction histidine kinase/CheY-like chemotaxis protein